jgi:hypothetical protein
MIFAIAAVITIALLAAIDSRSRNGDWRGPRKAARAARSVGRFVRGSGGDGWGGPRKPSPWDRKRRNPWE